MIKFARVRNVKSPTRRPLDAGIDFYIPEYNEELVDYIKNKNPQFELLGGEISPSGIVIPIGVDILIPSGLKCIIPENVCLIQFTKSGVGAKKKLDCFNGVIDASYQGEPHIHLINHGATPQVVEFGEKITQFVPVVYDTSELDVVDTDEGFFEKETVRGSGGFGSTSNK